MIAIKLNYNNVYVQRQEPETATEPPLDVQELVILKLYMEVEELKEKVKFFSQLKERP